MTPALFVSQVQNKKFYLEHGIPNTDDKKNPANVLK
jgi:hypothetical protein